MGTFWLMPYSLLLELKKTSLSFTDIMAAYSWLLILVLR